MNTDFKLVKNKNKDKNGNGNYMTFVKYITAENYIT